MPAGPHSATERRLFAHLSMAAALSLAAVSAVVLYRFPPTANGFYPICPVHEYLHLECPGCGTTRALAALVHGHLVEALRFNALAIGLVFPMGLIYGFVSYLRALRGADFAWPQLPTPAMYAGATLTAVFTLLRNL